MSGVEISAAGWLLRGIVVLLVVPVQVYWLPLLLGPGWTPHLGLLAAFLIGLHDGEESGVVFGLLLGLLYDRFTAGPVGIHILLLPFVGVVGAWLWRFVSVRHLPNLVLVLVGLALASESVALVLLHLTGKGVLDGWSLAHQLLPAIFADVFWGTLLLLFVRPYGSDDGFR